MTADAAPQPRTLRRPPAESAEAYLLAPRLRPGVVRRVALVNRLRTEHAPVIVVTAPAGYGKSTLLAQWAQRDARAFAWVALAPGDDGADAFLRTIVDALDRALPVPADVRASLEAPRTSFRTTIRRLGRFLLQQTRPLVIVIDDVEEVRSPEAHEIIATLCDHLGPNMQLVLSGRAAAPASVARLRVQGLLAELSELDLRLSDREAATLLHNAGVETPGEESEHLNARTEGWAAGLFLSTLALEGRQGKPIRAVGSARGDHRYIADYFQTEVLDRLPPESARFATEAAMLDAMSGPICDTVLEETGSARKLRRLSDAGAFVIAVDRERSTYRFHPFFRAMLRTRLEQETPQRFMELTRRAADWCVTHDDLPGAISHLLASGETDGAARVFGGLTGDVFGRGLLAPITGYLDDFRDEELLALHERTALTGAFAHALLGRAPEAGRWAAAAADAKPDKPLPGGPRSTAGWHATLRAGLCEDGLDRMREDATAALAELATHSPMRAPALFFLGVSNVALGDDVAAVPALEQAAEVAAAGSAAMIESLALAQLSLIAQGNNRWDEGELLARRALDVAERLESGHVAAALAFVAGARSALRNSNWVRAGDEIERIHRLLPRLTEALPWLSVQVRLELARVHLALNDVAAADELVTEIDRILLVRPHLGRLRDAARELRKHVSDVRREPSAIGTSLTAAELRLLPLLTTHLTFRQIAQHLYVSRNTIKTQAISVYRKLGVSSRTEAISRAVEVGLLKPEGEIPDGPG